MALGCLLVGCGDDGATTPEPEAGTTTGATSSSGELPNTAPVAATQFDAATACAMAGATRVELWASRVGCVNPPPSPCTVPNPPRPEVGTGVDCPATGETAVELEVELPQAGRYHVAVVTLAGTDEQARVCFGEDGMVELLVDDMRFADNPTIAVSDLGTSTCS